MKRVLLVGVVLLAVLAAEFFVGYQMGRSSNLVTIKLRNKSDNEVVSATFEHELGSRVVEGVRPGESEVVRFYAGEKCHYTLTAKLGNDHTLFAPRRLVRPGQVCTEVVTDTRIISNAN